MEQKIKLNIFKFIILFIYIFYWSLTLIYAGPENYVKIICQPLLINFRIFFEQKWAFFAPPPQGNYRLYYQFYDNSNNEIASFEVLELLMLQKKQNAPWNTKEETIDYIINGSIGNLLDRLITQREIYQQIFPDSSLNSLENLSRKKINTHYDEIPSYITLINYAKIVANRNLDISQKSKIDNLVIVVSEIKLPKFSKRIELLSDSLGKEGLVLKSSNLKMGNFYEKK